MSAEQDNVLAAQLEKGYSSIQSSIPVILGVLVALVVGSIAWGLYSSSENKKQAEAWTEYYFTTAEGGSESFTTIAESFSSSRMAGWAKLAAADDYLHSGIDLMFSNRTIAKDELGEAMLAYNAVLDIAKDDELRSKALLGLGRVHESLGQVDEAIRYYGDFIGANSIPALGEMANRRLAFLKSEEGKNFYAWFSELDPKPDAPISLPGNLGMPPTGPNMDFGPASPLAPTGSGLDPTGLMPLGGGTGLDLGLSDSTGSTDATPESDASGEEAPATEPSEQPETTEPETTEPETTEPETTEPETTEPPVTESEPAQTSTETPEAEEAPSEVPAPEASPEEETAPTEPPQ